MPQITFFNEFYQEKIANNRKNIEPSFDQGDVIISIHGEKKTIKVIEAHPKVVVCGHTWATFFYCLREMKYIARNGFEAYLQSRKQEIEKLEKSTSPKI